MNDTKPIIKFLIYLVSKPNKYGKINKNILEYSYFLDVVNSESNLESNDLIDIPFSLTIPEFHFQNNQKIFAWNDINISGNLTCDPNTSVDFNSGSYIIINSGTTISPNITLKIGLPEQCEPVPPVSNSFVKNFCTSQNYKANQLDLKVMQELELQKSINDYKQYSFSIYPNPADDYLTIKTSSQSQSIDCKIFSLIGEYYELPINLISNGVFRIDISNLTPGVYFVKIVGSNGACSIVEKFVKM